MDYINHITSLRTNKHLSYAERFFIEKSLQANMTKSAIATVLGRSRTTIYTKYAVVLLYKLRLVKQS
jgi:IS30 family transposase